MAQEFQIRQIYLKDLSFQAPMGASLFVEGWSPSVKVDMNVGHNGLGGDLTEVVLNLSVVATSGGGTAFMIEAVQAGIFHITGYDAAERDRILLGKCPAILLPYAREAIDSVLMKGRFPALILDPIDFEASRPSMIKRG